MNGKKEKDPRNTVGRMCDCGQKHEWYLPEDSSMRECACGQTIMPPLELIDLEVPKEIQDAANMMAGLQRVELKCEFIMVENWFIDVAKITHANIGNAAMMLKIMGGDVLIFENDDEAADVTGSVLKGPVYRALADYLRARFNATDVLTPVDKAFAQKEKGTTDASADTGSKD